MLVSIYVRSLAVRSFFLCLFEWETLCRSYKLSSFLKRFSWPDIYDLSILYLLSEKVLKQFVDCFSQSFKLSQTVWMFFMQIFNSVNKLSTFVNLELARVQIKFSKWTLKKYASVVSKIYCHSWNVFGFCGALFIFSWVTYQLYVISN